MEHHNGYRINSEQAARDFSRSSSVYSARILPVMSMRPQPGVFSPPYGIPPPLYGVNATLVGSDLWGKFNSIGNEMIITKSGRRMFPKYKVRLEGLEPDVDYTVVLEVRLAAPDRFKFSNGSWVAAGAADAQHSSRIFVHPESPAKGSAWAARDVDFQRPNSQGAKLTNNTLNEKINCLVLTSMHKYIPYVHIVRTSDVAALHCSPTASFAFRETEFIAVTAYQNNAITALKINHNDFAKGFRDSGKSKCKKKLQNEMPMLPMEVPCGSLGEDAVAMDTTVDSSFSSLGSSSLGFSLAGYSSTGSSLAGSASSSPPYSTSPSPPPVPIRTSNAKGYLSIDVILDPKFGPQNAQGMKPSCYPTGGSPCGPQLLLAQPPSASYFPADSWGYGYPSNLLYYNYPRGYPHSALPIQLASRHGDAPYLSPVDYVSCGDQRLGTVDSWTEQPRDLSTHGYARTVDEEMPEDLSTAFKTKAER